MYNHLKRLSALLAADDNCRAIITDNESIILEYVKLGVKTREVSFETIKLSKQSNFLEHEFNILKRDV